MKEIINEQEVKKFNRYSTILSVLFALAIASAVPLFMWLEVYAFIPFGVIWAVALFFAFKVDKLKKANNIRTYKEIVAFSEGRKLDEIDKRVEEGKRPYQKVLLIVGVAVVTAIACLLIGLLINYTLG